MLVTVVVPTFRRPRQLQGCLDALAAQTFREPWEVVVVDDGSPEPLELGRDGLPGRPGWRVVRQANAGPSAARNRGVQEARGEFVAFTDDDCRPEPSWLEVLVRAARERPGALVGGTTVNGLTGELFASTSQLIVDLVYEHFNADPEDAYFLASNNILCSRDQFLEIGGFDESFPRAGAEDRDFCDRWRMRRWPIVWRPEARVEHRHAQTFRQFVDLYIRYGRGAYRYQAIRKQRGSGTMREDLGFHKTLPRRLWRRLEQQGSLPSSIATVAALGVWQVANAAGFCIEALAAARERRLSRTISKSAGREGPGTPCVHAPVDLAIGREPSPEPVDVTVVVPAYRGAATIASCLASVQRATSGRNCQVVVVESSGDETAAIVSRDFPTVELVQSNARLSVGAARNLGVSRARGTLVFFVDQDCLVPPDWIDRLERHLRDPAVAAVGGSVGIADPANVSGDAVFFMEFFRHVRSRRPPDRRAAFLLGCNLCCRADALARVPFPDQTLGEDAIFTHAIRSAGYDVVYDPAVEVKHHNRRTWREFFRYNRAMGRAAADLHARIGTPLARPFLRHPALAFAAPLAILPLIAWRLAWSRWWYLPMFILLLPMCLLGNLAWADAFRREARENRENRGNQAAA